MNGSSRRNQLPIDDTPESISAHDRRSYRVPVAAVGVMGKQIAAGLLVLMWELVSPVAFAYSISVYFFQKVITHDDFYSVSLLSSPHAFLFIVFTRFRFRIVIE
jgi:uncharacterized membrane protein YhhN